jgi:hypothetical protein
MRSCRPTVYQYISLQRDLINSGYHRLTSFTSPSPPPTLFSLPLPKTSPTLCTRPTVFFRLDLSAKPSTIPLIIPPCGEMARPNASLPIDVSNRKTTAVDEEDDGPADPPRRANELGPGPGVAGAEDACGVSPLGRAGRWDLGVGRLSMNDGVEGLDEVDPAYGEAAEVGRDMGVGSGVGMVDDEVGGFLVNQGGNILVRSVFPSACRKSSCGAWRYARLLPRTTQTFSSSCARGRTAEDREPRQE